MTDIDTASREELLQEIVHLKAKLAAADSLAGSLSRFMHHPEGELWGISVERLLDIMQEGFAVLDAEGRLEKFNSAFAKLVGGSVESLKGRHATEVLNEDSRRRFTEEFARRRDGLAKAYELVFRQDDGSERTVIVTALPREDEKGNFLGSYALCTDVTPFRASEDQLTRMIESMSERILDDRRTMDEKDETLREQEEQYRSLFRRFPLPTFAWRVKPQEGDRGDSFILVDVNESARHVLKFPGDMMLGRTAPEIFGDSNPIAATLQTVHASGVPVSTELSFALFGAGPLDIHLHVSSVPPDALIMHVEDITARKRAERELRESYVRTERLVEQRTEELSDTVRRLKEEARKRENAQTELNEQRRFLRAVIDHDPSMVSVRDSEGRVTLANRAFAEFHNTAPDDVIGKTLEELGMNPREAEARLESDRTVVAAGRESGEFMESMTDRRGRIRWLSARRLPLYSSSLQRKVPLMEGEPLPDLVLEVASEVTDLKLVQDDLRRERDLLVSVMDTSPDGILVIGAEGKVLFANSFAAEVLHLGKGQALHDILSASDWKGIVYCDDSAPSRFPALDVLESADNIYNREICLVSRDGRKVFLSLNAAPLLDDSGRVTRAVCTLQDITRRKRAEESVELLSRTVEQSPVAVIITDPDGTIEYINPAFTRLMGYTLDDAAGDTPNMLKSGEHADEFYREMWETVLRGEKWRGEICNTTKQGGLVWVMASISPIHDKDGAVTHFVSIQEDISELKKKEEEIRRVAMHDALTELPNRILFMDRLTVALATAERQSCSTALLFIDLDRFKPVNDEYGHRVGDLLLIEAAARLRKCLRSMDTAARLGGDEFVILLQCVTSVEAVDSVATRVAESLAEPYDLEEGIRVTVGASVGISLHPQDGSDPDSLIRHADAAMYLAKKSSGRVKYYSQPAVRGGWKDEITASGE